MSTRPRRSAKPARTPRSSSPAPSKRKGAAPARAARIVVTGGAGFIGSNLVAEVLRRRPDAMVTVVDDFTSGSFANITQACARRGVVFTGEVIAQSVDEALPAVFGAAPADVLFHLGACTDTTVTDQSRMLHANAGPWWGALLGACADAGTRLVYASSAATYGTPPQAARREAFPLHAAGQPSNVYGFSKWVMENTHRAFVRECAERGERETWVVGLRYFNVFGPGETRKGKMASMPYQLATQCLRGERPKLFEHGEQARDQVHVDDVVDCTLAAGGMDADGTLRKGGVTPGVYNLGSGRATTFGDVAGAVRAGLGLGAGDREVEFIPMPASVREFYQDFTLADMRRTREGLGWSPTREPREAIRAYAAWLGGEGGEGGARG